MKLYLLRHASTRDIEQGINSSWTDVPLSEKGSEQAQNLVAVLSQKDFDVFIVSPLQRTRQTIQPYLDTLENPNVIIDERTIERNLGEFTNTRRGDGIIEKHLKEHFRDDRVAWKPPSGESLKDVAIRAKDFLSWLYLNYKSKSILICGHQGFLRSLELLLLNMSIDDFYSGVSPTLNVAEIRSYDYNY